MIQKYAILKYMWCEASDAKELGYYLVYLLNICYNGLSIEPIVKECVKFWKLEVSLESAALL